MCQVCAINDIATRERWPKPLEAPVEDIKFLVISAHDEYESNKDHIVAKNIPEGLLDILRTLATAVDELEGDREKWWSAPEKRVLRKRLDADCDIKRLTELHKINNATSERIEAMNAKLGGFVKWALSMNGGLWELVSVLPTT